jgi:hypothetical protein
LVEDLCSKELKGKYLPLLLAPLPVTVAILIHVSVPITISAFISLFLFLFLFLVLFLFLLFSFFLFAVPVPLLLFPLLVLFTFLSLSSTTIPYNISFHQQLILLLDGIDELLSIDRSQTLGWLPLVPGSLPEDGRVKLILSVRKGHKAQDILMRTTLSSSPSSSSSSPSMLLVKPLNETQRKRLTEQFMSLFGKSLTPSQLETLSRNSSSIHTSNPLFLRLILEEIRVFGVYEEIDSRIAYYLRARSLSELFERILDRLEKVSSSSSSCFFFSFISFLLSFLDSFSFSSHSSLPVSFPSLSPLSLLLSPQFPSHSLSFSSYASTFSLTLFFFFRTSEQGW